jgi:periplasmic protein TonB
MRALAEIAVVVVLSLMAHLGVAALGPEPTGASSQGDGGRASVTLAAAPATLADLVTAWETPPEVADNAAPQVVEPLPDMSSPVAPEITAPRVDPPVTQVTASAPLAAPMPEVAAIAVPALPVLAPAPEVPPGLAAPTADAAPALRPVAMEPPAQRMSQVTPDQPDAAPSADAAPPAPPEIQAPTKPQPRPKPRPAAASAAQPAQTAAGAGQTGQAGQSGGAKAASSGTAETQRALLTWGAQIRASIEPRKRYPKAAAGASGKAVLRLTVANDGALVSVTLVKSAGNMALDQAALAAVRAVRRFPAAPEGLAPGPHSFNLPIAFGA